MHREPYTRQRARKEHGCKHADAAQQRCTSCRLANSLRCSRISCLRSSAARSILAAASCAFFKFPEA
eukprot:6197723-Pleurochrysis_carterae.AAC.3